MPMLSVLTRMAIMMPRLKYLLSTILLSFSLKPSQVLTTLFLYSTTPFRLPRPRLPLRSPPWEMGEVNSALMEDLWKMHKEYCKAFHQMTLALIFKILDAPVHWQPPTPSLIYALLFTIFNQRQSQHAFWPGESRAVRPSPLCFPPGLPVLAPRFPGCGHTGGSWAAPRGGGWAPHLPTGTAAAGALRGHTQDEMVENCRGECSAAVLWHAFKCRTLWSSGNRQN